MKTVRKILSIFIIAVLIIALVLFTLPKLFGINMYNVTSGSMVPKYNIGDIVYVFPVKDGDGSNIQVDDVITFMISQESVVTHRVVRVERDEQTQGLTDKQRYLYYTKGDNNDQEDGAPRYFMNVIGVVRFSLPAVGKILQFFQTTQGLIIGVTILLALIIITIILNISAKDKDGDESKSSRRGASGNKKQKNGFDSRFGKKAIRERVTETDTLSGGAGNNVGVSDAAADIKREPPKGWGSGKSRQ